MASTQFKSASTNASPHSAPLAALAAIALPADADILPPPSRWSGAGAQASQRIPDTRPAGQGVIRSAPPVDIVYFFCADMQALGSQAEQQSWPRVRDGTDHLWAGRKTSTMIYISTYLRQIRAVVCRHPTVHPELWQPAGQHGVHPGPLIMLTPCPPVTPLCFSGNHWRPVWKRSSLAMKWLPTTSSMFNYSCH
jgi:hypothetical protein